MTLKRAEKGRRPTTMRGPLPLHMQITELLIREISAGRLADGARLPPERQMAADLKIAVGTLRHSLADLEKQGLLERIQGSGNYVRAQAEAAGVYAFFRLERIDGGGLPTAEVLSVDRLPKPADLPDFGTARFAHRIRRLRSLGGDPAAAEEIWLDGSRAKALSAADLSESLYLHYREAFGFTVQRAEDRVSISPVPDWVPDRFGPRPGAAAGYIERIAWDGAGASVEVSRTWYDTAVASYVTRFR